MQQECKPADLRVFLTELKDSGVLKLLHAKGFISWKIFLYLDVCTEYDLQIKCGASKMDSVYDTAIKFNLDIATVYRILNKLEYEYRHFDSNDKRKRGFSQSSDDVTVGTNS